MNAGFDTTINVNIPEQTEGENSLATLFETAAIDLTSNQDINDNLNLIENISLASLTFEVSNYIGAEDVTITNASITFGNTVISLADIALQIADNSNTVYEIQNVSQLGTMDDFLESNPVLNVVLNGTISSTPVAFEVIINLDTTVTVDAR